MRLLSTFVYFKTRILRIAIKKSSVSFLSNSVIGRHISNRIFPWLWFQRVITLCWRISVDVSYSSHNMWKDLRICLDKAPRLSIRRQWYLDLVIWYILSAQPFFFFQIVWRQCWLHMLVDMSCCTDSRYISTCVLRLSRQLPPSTLISTTFNNLSNTTG